MVSHHVSFWRDRFYRNHGYGGWLYGGVSGRYHLTLLPPYHLVSDASSQVSYEFSILGGEVALLLFSDLPVS